MLLFMYDYQFLHIYRLSMAWNGHGHGKEKTQQTVECILNRAGSLEAWKSKSLEVLVITRGKRHRTCQMLYINHSRPHPHHRHHRPKPKIRLYDSPPYTASMSTLAHDHQPPQTPPARLLYGSFHVPKQHKQQQQRDHAHDQLIKQRSPKRQTKTQVRA